MKFTEKEKRLLKQAPSYVHVYLYEPLLQKQVYHTKCHRSATFLGEFWKKIKKMEFFYDFGEKEAKNAV